MIVRCLTPLRRCCQKAPIATALVSAGSLLLLSILVFNEPLPHRHLVDESSNEVVSVIVGPWWWSPLLLILPVIRARHVALLPFLMLVGVSNSSIATLCLFIVLAHDLDPDGADKPRPLVAGILALLIPPFHSPIPLLLAITLNVMEPRTTTPSRGIIGAGGVLVVTLLMGLLIIKDTWLLPQDGSVPPLYGLWIPACALVLLTGGLLEATLALIAGWVMVTTGVPATFPLLYLAISAFHPLAGPWAWVLPIALIPALHIDSYGHSGFIPGILLILGPLLWLAPMVLRYIDPYAGQSLSWRLYLMGKWHWDPWYRQLQSMGLQPQHILDAGCGNALSAKALRQLRKTAAYTGIDLDAGKLVFAKVFLRSLRWQEHHLIQSTLPEGIPQKKPYDLILCADILHYWPWDQQRQVLEALCARLESEGTLILRTTFDAPQNSGTTAQGERWTTWFGLNPQTGTLTFPVREALHAHLESLGLTHIETIPSGGDNQLSRWVKSSGSSTPRSNEPNTTSVRFQEGKASNQCH